MEFKEPNKSTENFYLTTREEALHNRCIGIGLPDLPGLPDELPKSKLIKKGPRKVRSTKPRKIKPKKPDLVAYFCGTEEDF